MKRCHNGGLLVADGLRKPIQSVGTDESVLSILSGTAHSRRAPAS